MPSFVKVPRNESVLREFGPYPSLLNLGEGSTAMQTRRSRRGIFDWEPGTQSTLYALVQLAKSRPVEFFDVGAHVGMYSLLISTIFPADTVHVTAFEPTPLTAHIFRSLAAANQLPIRIERCAVSQEEGTAELYISPWDTSNSLLAGFRPARETVTVPLVSLDAYCERRGIRPTVMKIDVETLESQVLLGGLKAIEEGRTSIVCEMLAAADPAATANVLGELVARGYHLHRWQHARGWDECSAEDIVNQIPHDGKDWLFTPEPVGDRFHTALDEWRAAIAECTSETSVVGKQAHAIRRPPRYGLSGAGSATAAAPGRPAAVRAG